MFAKFLDCVCFGGNKLKGFHEYFTFSKTCISLIKNTYTHKVISKSPSSSSYSWLWCWLFKSCEGYLWEDLSWYILYFAFCKTDFLFCHQPWLCDVCKQIKLQLVFALIVNFFAQNWNIHFPSLYTLYRKVEILITHCYEEKKKKGNGFKGLVLEDKRQCKIDFTFANTKGRFPVQEFSEKI